MQPTRVGAPRGAPPLDEPPVVVADLMTEAVFSASPDDPLDSVLGVMLDRGIRHMPIEDDEGHVVGIVSQRDIVAAGAPVSIVDAEAGSLSLLARNLEGKRAQEVMSSPDVVSPETPIVEAAELLLENHYGCLPVVENERLVGILTEADFVGLVVRSAG